MRTLREDWKPKDVPSLEPTADRIVRGAENTLVIAGPGAGKTELLAQRACYLLETGICCAPRRILAISFKRDAAKNLQDRVQRRVGIELAHRFDSFTFDAFAKSLVDRFLNGLPGDFRPSRDYQIDTGLGVNTVSQKARIRTVLDSIADGQGGLTYANLQTLNTVTVYNDYIIGRPLPVTIPNSAPLPILAALYAWRYLLRTGNFSVLNFQMIGRLAELLLRVNQPILRALRLTYNFVFLDEFQDTTGIHYELTKTAFLSSDALLTAVGDEKQRIMIWAGALRGIFEEYRKDFSARVRGLVMNYRSAPRLVRIQSHFIAALDPDAQTPQAADDGLSGEGECEVLVFSDHEQESRHLSLLIEKWRRSEKVPSREICILVRNRPDKYTEVLQQSLLERGISSRIENSLQDLLSEPLTISLLNFLKLAARSREPRSWEETCSLLLQVSGIDNEDSRETERILDRLSKFRKELALTLQEISDERQILKTLEQIAEFVGPSALKQLYPQYEQGNFYEETLRNCARELAIARRHTESWTTAIDDFEGLDAVPIMTIHKSKGLEYHTVVFVGLEDAALWSYSSNQEEETCGFFVAFSRAKKRVLFTFSELRPDPRTGRLTVQERESIAPIYDLLGKAGVTPIRVD
jgi:DNA helicase-2/ATP-dependent DNA helicase PcrA